MKYLRIYGSRILSMITEDLIAEEKEKIKEAGFTLNPSYKPELTISRIRSGSVVPKSPISQDEFGRLSIDEILLKLKSDWTPENLHKQNKSGDFLNPLNAEGVSRLLQNDIPQRFQEYINNANFFFERESLDQHYTYSFIRAIQETLRDNKAENSKY